MEEVVAKIRPNPTPDPPAPMPDESSSKSGCLSIIVRLSWIFGGISILVYCAVFIAMDKHRGTMDILYWAIVAAIVLLRFVDIRFLKGETLDNKPATFKHWRGYVVKMSAAAAILFAVAKFIAHKNLV
jgi:hypothetical protein